MEKKALIEVKNLVKEFNGVRVIDGLTINFYAGDRVALIGQNGAGKTTLIRCILGLYTFEGYLRVLQKNPRTDREEILHRVSFVPQLPPPLRMTVEEILDLFDEITRLDKEKFFRIVRDLKLDIENHMQKPFLKLSGGMKQKLLVGLALARNPGILLMDEPTANLDPEARRVLVKYLEQLPEDTLLILSSHRVKEIGHLVNRLVEMDLGKVVVDEPYDPATMQEEC
ncbi:MAG: ABC transporter ATP-binding protein [Chlorobi bacterium]|nr:ABC transporter ATP-binding protein [Chlorobiota bacterium]